MPEIDRDKSIIEHILRYCGQIDTAHQDFGHSRERFDQSSTYQNAVSMWTMSETYGKWRYDYR